MSKQPDLINHARKHPARVLKLFTIFSTVSILSILLLVGLGIYRIYYHYIIRDAENNAMRIAYTIFEQERDRLISADQQGNTSLFVKKDDFAVLDERMKRYLQPLNMFKIKFFSTGKEIVYSTDQSIIGKTDDKNVTLDRALKGEVVSKIVKKGSVLDLAGEKRYDVDVVETYLPIIDKDHDIVGSFEVYIDVTRSYSEIRKVVTASVSVLSVVLVLVFSVLFFLMARLTRQLAKTQNELQVMAITDGLTKIYNRRYLISRADEEFDKVLRKKVAGLGFIMVDIDHFKNINDTYGHPVGDEVLTGVAGRIRKTIRKYDMAGRYGGEEFLIILPNADFEDVKAGADRIWKAIREKSFDQCKVTVSLGIACTNGTDKDVNAVIKRADEGLYKAKNNGRDQVSWV